MSSIHIEKENSIFFSEFTNALFIAYSNDDNSATVLKSTFQGSHDRWFQKSPAVAALVLSSLQ